MRFVGCLIGYLVCFAVTLLMVRIDNSEWIPAFFYSTLAIVIAITVSIFFTLIRIFFTRCFIFHTVIYLLIQVFTAVFQTSIFGLAAEFPAELGIMTAVMGGQGCGGIFACVVNLATLGEFKVFRMSESNRSATTSFFSWI